MRRKVGVWLIGVYGSIGTCLVAGAAALNKKVASTTGLVSELREFAGMGLISLSDLVFGGYDIRESSLQESAQEFSQRNGVLTPEILRKVRNALEECENNIRLGFAINCGRAVEAMATPRCRRMLHPAEIVERIHHDILDFRQRNLLEHIVVVNIASAEASMKFPSAYRSRRDFEKALAVRRAPAIHMSVLYAWAAISQGYPYINFTSSPGSSIPAVIELAEVEGVPHMGKDGKTGETLLKSVLGPLFIARNLRVLSWESHNLLGNRDGEVLSYQEHRDAKMRDKNTVLSEILKEQQPHTAIRIDYVPSLGDWKTAWDLIHFEGFLGTRMTLQFIWQGNDSALAAPLVLDLIRFAELSARRGEKGAMTHLACFFKNPIGVREHSFQKQFDQLLTWARSNTRGEDITSHG